MDIAAASLSSVRKTGTNGFQTRQKGWQKLHRNGESFLGDWGIPTGSKNSKIRSF
jgi:hypothetical protein